MKKRMIAWLTMAIGAASLFGAFTAYAEAESEAAAIEELLSDEDVQAIIDYGKLKVGCKVDVPKYGYLNPETDEYEGIEIDISYDVAGAIFGCTAEEAKEQGLVEFQGVTGKTRGPLLESGEIDMVIATFTITEERKESYNFSTPYIEDAVGIMCLTASEFGGVEDLDGCVIGIQQSTITGDLIDEYIESQGYDVEVSYEEFENDPALSTALLTENIDGFADDRCVLNGYITDETMILPDRFGVQDYGIASALEKKGLAQLIDAVVIEKRADGTIDSYIEKYGIE